ncbi:unnamed protein product, partial [Polarella glacialis]
ALGEALSQFQFQAWSFEDCPYAARYCIPFPGVALTNGPNNLCIPQISGEVAAALGSQLTSSLDMLSSISVVQDAVSSLSSAPGSLLTTLDALAVVMFCSLAISLSFMVLIRFFVGPMVWIAILIVLLMFVGGGCAGLVRLNQCADQSYASSGEGLATSVAQTTQSVVQNVSSQTQSGVPTISLPGADYCKIHGSKSTPTGTRRWPACDSCSSQGGYTVSDSTARQVLQVCSYVVLGLAGLWVLLICCLRSRISLAIAVNKVAAEFVHHTPQILLVPLTQTFVGLVWLVGWGVCAAFILSQVPAGYVPNGAFATEAEAAGTPQTPGACTSHWPSGYAYQDASNCVTDAAGTVQCWRCAPPRAMMGQRSAYIFFSLLWHNALLVAIGQCTVAGAVGGWFFAPRAEKSSRPVLRAAL